MLQVCAAVKKDMEPVQPELVAIVNSGEMGKLFFSRHIQHVVSATVSRKMQDACERFLFLGSEQPVTLAMLQHQVSLILAEMQEASSQQTVTSS